MNQSVTFITIDDDDLLWRRIVDVPEWFKPLPDGTYRVTSADPFVDVLTLEQFLAAYETHPDLIEMARVLPPQLGSEGFGKVLVRRKFPIDFSLDLNTRIA